MDSVPLSTFPPALARLLLCGGGGLPAAYGPLLLRERGADKPAAWTGDRAVLLTYGRGAIAQDMDELTRWSIPLESSPWPARMAVVAAWMLEEPCDYASVDRRTDNGWIVLRIHDRFRSQCSDWRWTPIGGALTARRALPTLPDHLAQHPPEVALLLALYDVPEIKARVEALQ